jgi:hypothetical protein
MQFPNKTANLRDKVTNPMQGKESEVSQKVSHQNFRARNPKWLRKKENGTGKEHTNPPPAFCVPNSTAPFREQYHIKKHTTNSTFFIIYSNNSDGELWGKTGK